MDGSQQHHNSPQQDMLASQMPASEVNPTRASSSASAASVRLKKRADFKRLAPARRVHGRGFSIAMLPQPASHVLPVARIGFTVTKQCGNAVKRNRIKRRLKEAMRCATEKVTKSGHDYVLFGRVEALNEDFARLQQRLCAAITTLHTRPSSPLSSPSLPPPHVAKI